MDPERMVDQLVESGVTRSVEDEEALELTDEFRDAVDRRQSELEAMDEGSLLREVEAVGPNREAAREFAELFGDDVEILAEYCALSQFLPSFSHEEILQLLRITDQFRKGPPPADGAPDAFLPVHGDRVTSLVRMHPAAIVYIWREDCEPCDLVKDDFDALIDTPPDDIALYAVFGPDWAEHLLEAFDVVGAPTTLFMLDGRVDVRLQGAHARSTLEAEIGILEDEV